MITVTHLLFFLPFIHGSPRVDPLVNTNIGLIRGLRSDNGQYSMFLGIPYALVNESNPFGSSIPHPGFDNTFEANDDSTVCPQIVSNVAMGSLQCLHVNIYVPNTATSQNPLPVMVWIHGGAFIQGNGNRQLYSPDFLVRHDVIVVGFNYRLGPYGFFCLDTPEIPGNQGLKDQLLALRWINENIGSFGGDKNQITVFGESAGSVSIDLHLLSKQEKMFDKAILQSGTAFLPGMIGESDKELPSILAAKMGYTTNNSEDAIAFLSTQDPLLLINVASEITTTSIILTKPCVEKDFEGVEKFIEDYPANVKPTKIQSIPILHGFNNNELSILSAYMPYQVLEILPFKEFITSLLGLINSEVADIVSQFYVGDEIVAQNNGEELENFAADYTFYSAAERTLKKYVNEGASAIYYYVFSYSGDRNHMKITYNISAEGAAHADELGYLFDQSIFTDQPTAEDQLVIDRITTLWTNFAKYGKPIPQTSDLLPINWNPITQTTRPYLNIDKELSLRSRPFHGRMAFWELFYKLTENTMEYK